MSQVLLCQGFDDMRLTISYGLYVKEIFKVYCNVVPHYFSYMYMHNYMKGLVQNLREVKYAVLHPKNVQSSRGYSRVVTKI